MSLKAMSAAFEIGDRLDLPAIDRLLLLRLGDWSDDYGYSWPGLDDLVAKVGVDKRTIRRHLSALEEAGLLIRIFGKGGRHRSNLYRILPEFLPDDARAPGRLRYLSRFGIEQKEDSVSAFSKERRSPGTEKEDSWDPKGGHSSVLRSSKIHQDPLADDLEIETEGSGLRRPGESRKDAVRRILSELGKEIPE